MKIHTSEKASKQKKILYSVIAVVALAMLLAGFSRAWFYNQMDMETLMEVKEPDPISILGPGGSEMASLDLTYNDSDKDANGKVTVKRVICVQSSADYHKLEIVHTTNLKGIEFKLYEATKPTTGENGNVSDGGYTYQYDSQKPITGSYVNKKEYNSEYKYATDAKHKQNFDDADKVQSHAEPLYWKVNQAQKASTADDIKVTENGTEITKHRTYYVCEVSWTETTKETDVFYILAATAAAQN